MIKLSDKPAYKIEVLTGIAPFDVDYHVEVEKIINGETKYRLRDAYWLEPSEDPFNKEQRRFDVFQGDTLWTQLQTYILKEIEKGTVQWT